MIKKGILYQGKQKGNAAYPQVLPHSTSFSSMNNSRPPPPVIQQLACVTVGSAFGIHLGCFQRPQQHKITTLNEEEKKFKSTLRGNGKVLSDGATQGTQDF